MTTIDDLSRELETLQQAILAKALTTEDITALKSDLQRIEDRLASLPGRKQRSIVEFRGAGKELWRSVDVDEYIQAERDSWR